ncbi:26S proteasome non-ATPase regulatory subunit 3 [Nymphon striatum]|nr:26S proteasome non-ATPase regulatory subunit 3 [Nymphon striatum]
MVSEESSTDVEMKSVEPSTNGVTKEKESANTKDTDTLTLEDIKEHVRHIEKSVNTKEPRFVSRVLRCLVSTRKKLNPFVLRKLVSGYFSNQPQQKELLLGFIEELMETDGPVTPFRSRSGKSSQLMPEIETYIHLLVLLHLIDLGKHDEATQLDYSEAHKHLTQAMRKAPQNSAVGFRQTVQKLAITVELLLGDIPDRALFRQQTFRRTLAPYFLLTQAVKAGNLGRFNEVLDNFGTQFQADHTYTLIIRLRHNVIKTGVRMISLSYSRISLANIATKLQLDSAEDAEYIVAKKTLIYIALGEPQEAFHQRITFCLDIHNQSVKAMRFPAKSYHKDLESAEQTIIGSRKQAPEAPLWRKTDSNEYTSVLNNKVWTLKQTEEELLYKIHGPEEILETSKQNKNGSIKRAKTTSKSNKKLKTEDISNVDNNEKFLRDYLQLDVDLKALYKNWSDADSNFKKLAPVFKGIRMLRQDPTENLISFICSSNNNISRIVKRMESNESPRIQRNKKKKGRRLEKETQVDLEKLSNKDVDQELRKLGFGYRAKYIQKTAELITQEYPPNWLQNLRNVPYDEAHQSLVKLSGVGAKVADCVCLMSLDKYEAIPVDTHVWQIARRDYMPGLKKNKSLTDKTYKEIGKSAESSIFLYNFQILCSLNIFASSGDHFRKLFGEYAGWAHSDYQYRLSTRKQSGEVTAQKYTLQRLKEVEL